MRTGPHAVTFAEVRPVMVSLVFLSFLPFRGPHLHAMPRQGRHGLKSLFTGICLLAGVKSQSNYVNPEDFGKLLAAIDRIEFRDHRPEQVKVLFKITYWCALRIREALALRWDDIDWDGPTIRLRKTKTGKNVQVLIPPGLIEDLDNWYQAENPADDSLPMFAGIKYINVYKWLKRLGEITGLEALKAAQSETGEKTLAHIFRKSMAKDMLQGEFGKRADINLVARKLRHENLATTSKYLKVGIDAEREFWEKGT